MIKKYIIGATFATFTLVGCGSSTSTDTSLETTGYLVDAAVANVDYDCVADNDYNNTTGLDGAFTCRNMHQIRFRLGELILGEISALPSDQYVFPQDLVGVQRADLENSHVLAMAQLLQSLDDDGNLTNGIQISQEVKTLLDKEKFTPENLELYLGNAVRELAHIRSQIQAREHLQETMQALNVIPE